MRERKAIATIMSIILGVLPATADESGSHGIAVDGYADTAAAVETASQECPDLLANTDGLADLREALHLVEGDVMAAGIRARQTMAKLRAAAQAAPDRRVWCDEAYRLYGPDGALVAGLLGREGSR